MRITVPALAIALTALSATACSTDATGPSTPPPEGQTLSMSQFDSALGTGTTRIQITLLSGGLVAREVEVEPDDAEEKIVSAATAIDPVEGTLTLELGGLTLRYGASTRFRTATESQVTRSEWEASIQAALAGGQRPPIEARRNPPASPQAPSDPAFVAADLRLADQPGDPKIEIYVDADNLESVAAPPPLALLRVLGLAIEITSGTRLGTGTGTTPAGIVEFQGAVASVNPGEGAFTLADGTVIRVPAGTIFDPLGDLFSLQAMADAVASGALVRAEGRGTVDSAGPPVVIAAQTVKVEVDN